MTPTLLKFPHEDIVFENYEDEMILLNLPEGVYFTLDSVGADCLLILLSAPSAAAAMAALMTRYVSPAQEIGAGIAQLVELVTAAGLVVARIDGQAGLDVAPATADVGAKYSAPRLERYEDVEDILKFDPVHEVTQAGWPSIRSDAIDKP